MDDQRAEGRRRVTLGQGPAGQPQASARYERFPGYLTLVHEGAGPPDAVAITFDDGPDPDWTPALLDTLKAEGVRATFFLIGANMEKHPDLVRRPGQALPRPDLLLAPINGQDFFRTQRNCIGNLEAEEAAQLAVRLSAACTIPTHYDMVQGNTVDPLRFAAALRQLDPAACFALPALGERLLFQADAGRKDSSVFSCPPPSSSIQR